MKAEVHFDDIWLSIIADKVAALLKPLLLSRKDATADSALMGVADLAAHLGASKDWIYQRTCKNEIPFIKIGRIIKFRRSDIDKWLSARSVPAVAPLSAPLPRRRARDSESRVADKSPCDIA